MEQFFFSKTDAANIGDGSSAAAPRTADHNGHEIGEEFFSASGVEIQSKEVQREIVRAQEKMFKRGRYDGALGIPLDVNKQKIENLAKTLATQIGNEATIKISGELEGAKTTLKEQERKRDQLRKSEQQHSSYVQYLRHVKRFDPRAFASTTVWMYLFCGFVLTIADFPLALKLIKKGFNLDPGFEQWVTAVGIATCTIFIKVIYDEFIGVPYGSPVLSRKKFFGLFSAKEEELPEFTADEEKWIKYHKTVRSIVKIFILVLTLVTIRYLGVFRSTTIERADAEAALNIRNAKVLDSLSGKASPAELDSLAKERDKELLTLRQNQTEINRPTFMLLTLLFPLISGVCFSIGFSSRQNKKNLKTATADMEAERQALFQCDELCAACVLNKNALEESWKHIANENWLSNFSSILTELYYYGYTIGKTRPELVYALPDFLTIVEASRNKKISYLTNELLLT